MTGTGTINRKKLWLVAACLWWFVSCAYGVSKFYSLYKPIHAKQEEIYFDSFYLERHGLTRKQYVEKNQPACIEDVKKQIATMKTLFPPTDYFINLCSMGGIGGDEIRYLEDGRWRRVAYDMHLTYRANLGIIQAYLVLAVMGPALLAYLVFIVLLPKFSAWLRT